MQFEHTFNPKTKDTSVCDMIARLEDEDCPINLNPHYQRGQVWE